MNLSVLYPARGHTPKIGQNVFLAPTACVVGDVVIGDGSSVWFNTVVRGDVCAIRFGRECNIQDGTVVHGTYKKCGVTVGDRVSIGHSVVLHGCEIGDETLIGMGSILMDLSKVGKNCIIGAGSLVTEGTEIPDGWLAFGRPTKAVRPLTQKELEFLPRSANNYLLYKSWYEPGYVPEKKDGE